MHRPASVAIAALALLIVVLPASSREARAAIDCAVLNAKIAELEKPINELRDVIKGLAAALAMHSEDNNSYDHSPTHTLLGLDEQGMISRKLASLRAQTAANEPVLRDLRALRIQQCSGQPRIMVHAAPESPAVVDSPSVRYVPTTRVYGSPVPPHRYNKPRIASYDHGKKHIQPKAKKKHTAKTHKRSHTQQVQKKSGKPKKPHKTKKHKSG